MENKTKTTITAHKVTILVDNTVFLKMNFYTGAGDVSVEGFLFALKDVIKKLEQELKK